MRQRTTRRRPRRPKTPRSRITLVDIPAEAVELPEGKAWPRIWDSQQRYEATVWIRTYHDRFIETGNPIDLLYAFTNALQIGMYPPFRILTALGEAFEQVLAGNGTVSLDRVLKLRGHGKGAWNAFTVAKRRGLQYWLAHTLFALKTGWKLSLDEAAERLSFHLESRPGRRYTATGLIDQYQRVWVKRFHLDRITPMDLHHPASWPKDHRETFLKSFPPPASVD